MGTSVQLWEREAARSQRRAREQRRQPSPGWLWPATRWLLGIVGVLAVCWLLLVAVWAVAPAGAATRHHRHHGRRHHAMVWTSARPVPQRAAPAPVVAPPPAPAPSAAPPVEEWPAVEVLSEAEAEQFERELAAEGWICPVVNEACYLPGEQP